MANDTIKTTFDKSRYEKLKKCYNQAIKNKKEQFPFEGEMLLVSYAKYLLEYIKPLMK